MEVFLSTIAKRSNFANIMMLEISKFACFFDICNPGFNFLLNEGAGAGAANTVAGNMSVGEGAGGSATDFGASVAAAASH